MEAAGSGSTRRASCWAPRSDRDGTRSAGPVSSARRTSRSRSQKERLSWPQEKATGPSRPSHGRTRPSCTAETARSWSCPRSDSGRAPRRFGFQTTRNAPMCAETAISSTETSMSSSVTEIAPDTYRISTFHPEGGIQTNQFLIEDEEPFLMHTGFENRFPATLHAVASIMDPARLRWIGVSHFEADECGALNEWLTVAPEAQALCGTLAARLNIADFAHRPPRSLADAELIQTGRHRLRFLETPHMPHGWDAGLFFDETEQTLFCSDLFLQPGDPEPVIGSGIVQRARDAIYANLKGPAATCVPYTPFTQSTLQRLAALNPRTLAVMHGSSFRGDGRKALLHLAAVMNDLLGKGDRAA